MLSTTPPIPGLNHSEAMRRRRHISLFSKMWRGLMGYIWLIWGIVANWLHLVIIGLAVALWSVGLHADALATSSVVVLNIVVSIFQMVRARYQLNRLSVISMPRVAVWRDGALQRIVPDDVVVGDVVLLATGDQVVADGCIVSADHLALDESLLTGESEPQTHGDGDSIVAGAICVHGSAWYTVTSFDGVAYQLQQRGQMTRLLRTPLMHQIDEIMRVILAVVAGLSVIVVIRAWNSEIPLAIQISQLAVIAGLIPNALVLMLTMSYAIAAVHMARVGGLVQQLAAVESMHHINILCLDKTGTITLNQLSVQNMYAVGVSDSEFQSALASFVANEVTGNATIQAIARALPGQPTVVHHHVPFDSTRKWSLQVQDSGVWVLGAPDILIPAMTTLHHHLRNIQYLQQHGARVLFFARANVHSDMSRNTSEQLPTELILYGYVVLSDAIRPQIEHIMAQCQQQGIKVCVLSGDHPDAVRAFVGQVSHVVAGDVYHGAVLDSADDVQLAQIVQQAAVYGRLTPAHKARIVTMWRTLGYRVAMIGDGLNDIPAMRAADIAIAMQSGSSAVRLVADVVLLNDDFAIVPHLFQQGKRIVSRMSLVLNHFLLRIVTSAVILGLSVVASIPLWMPWQSSLVALCGVALPSLYIVGMRAESRELLSLSQMIRYASVIAIVVSGMVIATHVMLPTYSGWVGVGISLLVLWGHAAWLTWSSTRA